MHAPGTLLPGPPRLTISFRVPGIPGVPEILYSKTQQHRVRTIILLCSTASVPTRVILTACGGREFHFAHHVLDSMCGLSKLFRLKPKRMCGSLFAEDEFIYWVNRKPPSNFAVYADNNGSFSPYIFVRTPFFWGGVRFTVGVFFVVFRRRRFFQFEIALCNVFFAGVILRPLFFPPYICSRLDASTYHSNHAFR